LAPKWKNESRFTLLLLELPWLCGASSGGEGEDVDVGGIAAEAEFAGSGGVIGGVATFGRLVFAELSPWPPWFVGSDAKLSVLLFCIEMGA
jgi:hypothetical protein